MQMFVYAMSDDGSSPKIVIGDRQVDFEKFYCLLSSRITYGEPKHIVSYLMLHHLCGLLHALPLCPKQPICAVANLASQTLTFAREREFQVDSKSAAVILTFSEIYQMTLAEVIAEVEKEFGTI
jgi:hypothetical protein